MPFSPIKLLFKSAPKYITYFFIECHPEHKQHLSITQDKVHQCSTSSYSLMGYSKNIYFQSKIAENELQQSQSLANVTQLCKLPDEKRNCYYSIQQSVTWLLPPKYKNLNLLPLVGVPTINYSYLPVTSSFPNQLLITVLLKNAPPINAHLTTQV